MLRELAPSREAFGIADPEEFERAYVAGVEEIGLDAIVGRLAKVREEAGGLPLVLLCFEDLSQPGQWCHRQHLSRWLGEHGIRAKELKPGDLPQRPNSSEPRLF